MIAQLALLAAQAAADSKKKSDDAASAAISRAESRASGRTGDKNINVDLGVFAKPKNLVTLGVVFLVMLAAVYLFQKRKS